MSNENPVKRGHAEQKPQEKRPRKTNENDNESSEGSPRIKVLTGDGAVARNSSRRLLGVTHIISLSLFLDEPWKVIYN